MLKRTMAAALMIALVITAGSAMAQCVIGVYADAAGTESVTAPTEFQPFSAYVILRDDAAVEGASYQITFPVGISVVQRLMGPNGAGFEFLSGAGGPWVYDTIVGFGECAIGFGGNDILVAEYVGVAIDNSLTNVEISLSANPTDPGGPTGVEYATCSGQIAPCDGVLPLLITHVIGTESKSFGAVKSLY